jgi:regulator of protease activity HflC (stomatin/prohibitin superfamily)
MAPPASSAPSEIRLTSLPAFADARGLMRLLGRLAALHALLLLVVVATVFWARHHPGRLPALDALLRQGFAGALAGALALTLTGLLASQLIVAARHRSLAWETGDSLARRAPVTSSAGWPQAILILTGAAVAMALLWRFRPLPPLPSAVATPWPISAGLLLLPAFILIICERVIAAMPSERFPESPRLAALLRLPPFAILAHILLIAAVGFGLPLGSWWAVAVDLFLAVVAAELALRTLGIWFLPPPAPDRARAAVGSIGAALLQPGALRPSEVARRMRAQFGIDITRSWAVSYARTAAAPVLLALLIFAWGLSGVVRIGLSERGSYERFGASVAMLRPGLHAVLPWPFGRVRHIEYGVVHSVAVATAMNGGTAPADTSTADGGPPLSASRLWDLQIGNDTSYIIASSIADRQTFETVSVNLNVLYRVGLDDASARRALYGTIDSATLVRSIAGRELAHFFADRTLPEVLGERNEEIATQLKFEVQNELDRRQSGLQVLALIVESLHPPSGAVMAYRGVQTAQIVAAMRRSQEEGRAQGTLNVAKANAHEMRDQAQASSAELVSSAAQERWRSDADILAYRNGGRAFLLERYFSNLRLALPKAALEIVDNRLSNPDAPVLDLRPVTSTSGPGSAAAPDTESPADSQ